MDHLTSSKNPQIKEARKLWKRRERDKSNHFLIEGFRELTRALRGDVSIETLFIAPELFLGANEPALIEQIKQQGATVYSCPKALFSTLSYRDRPDGLIAVANQLRKGLSDLSGDFFVVAEAIEKPGNLGTIIRSSDASGVNGVIVCDRCTDLHNPNVVRASVGTLFTLPVVETGGEEALEWLQKGGIQILAATPHATCLYTDVDLTAPVAIVVGTEQYGLSERWMERADLQVRIPMHGEADSLNVAMATTLLLYEVIRQRHKS